MNYISFFVVQLKPHLGLILDKPVSDSKPKVNYIDDQVVAKKFKILGVTDVNIFIIRHFIHTTIVYRKVIPLCTLF
jgi:hypothetical protein